MGRGQWVWPGQVAEGQRGENDGHLGVPVMGEEGPEGAPPPTLCKASALLHLNWGDEQRISARGQSQAMDIKHVSDRHLP